MNSKLRRYLVWEHHWTGFLRQLGLTGAMVAFRLNFDLHRAVG